MRADVLVDRLQVGRGAELEELAAGDLRDALQRRRLDGDRDRLDRGLPAGGDRLVDRAGLGTDGERVDRDPGGERLLRGVRRVGPDVRLLAVRDEQHGGRGYGSPGTLLPTVCTATATDWLIASPSPVPPLRRDRVRHLRDRARPVERRRDDHAHLVRERDHCDPVARRELGAGSGTAAVWAALDAGRRDVVRRAIEPDVRTSSTIVGAPPPAVEPAPLRPGEPDEQEAEAEEEEHGGDETHTPRGPPDHVRLHRAATRRPSAARAAGRATAVADATSGTATSPSRSHGDAKLTGGRSGRET